MKKKQSFRAVMEIKLDKQDSALVRKLAVNQPFRTLPMGLPLMTSTTSDKLLRSPLPHFLKAKMKTVSVTTSKAGRELS